HFRQHTRARIDRAIKQSFAELGRDPFARLAFANLLHHVRANSSLLRPTGDGSQQLLALEALRNIARHHDDYLVWPSTWPGGEASVHVLVHSLASHLFGRYPISRMFGQVWFGGDTAVERLSRRWFIEHAGGRRFRDIANLPMKMTRKMERILLNSPHHLPLRAAMRRAEILGLGGEPELVDAVLATPLAHDLDNGDVWRGAMHFFVNHWQELGSESIPTIVEFIYGIRIRTVDIAVADGTVIRAPLEPNFSLTGRTPASVLGLCSQWKYDCLVGARGAVSWAGSGLPSMGFEDELGEWRIFELLGSGALQIEGRNMRNCVASYWRECVNGRSSIWSLRLWANGSYASRCTIEVRKATRTVVQIRGPQNRPALGRLRTMIERWAARAGLTIAGHAW
ncbi:MAG TPA: PcfJ domain-containing protein, partial [Enhygromyxa sp.]|nr:PcfJ domain-containing protein [Enhygromyxa sp.]